MKAILTEKKKQKFEPFEITLKLESVHEIQALYHRLNIPWGEIRICDREVGVPPSCTSTFELWDILDDYLDINDLKDCQ